MQATTYAFVYGTLRQGEGNSPMMVGATLVDWSATTHGRLYYAHRGYDTYPKSILSNDVPELVTGDVWDVTNMASDAWDRVERMERGAGYGLSVIDVTLSDGTTVKAKAFTVPDARGLGDLIECGDWKKRPAPAPAPADWGEEPQRGACILTGADGENEDDCTTHDHEGEDDWDEPCECGGGEYSNQPHAPTCPYFTDCRDCGLPCEQCACGFDADRVRIEILDDVTEADLEDDPHEADCLCDDCWASGRRPPR
jgi:gamma-glutamylcyclotransferase (GGCT)/AIG2-like uncharacterized protein YtfP